MDALAFATLGFATDGLGAGGTTAVILSDVEVEDLLDVAALSPLAEVTVYGETFALPVTVGMPPDVVAPALAAAEPDLEITTCP